MGKRLVGFCYGLVSYCIFLATFVYAAGFVSNVLVPKTLDSPPRTGFLVALVVDLGLLALFAVQHSGMARPAFKKWWTRTVPEPLERSTYVLFSSLALIVLFAFWLPLGGRVWHLTHPGGRLLIHATAVAGWLLVLSATFMINHFDLFGLRQVWLYLFDRPYKPLPFTTPALYGYVRHPLYVGWLLAFWATPTMTVTHLLFAGATTVYILGAVRLEESDLKEAHPEYRDYCSRVPRLLPRFTRAKGPKAERMPT